jgi:hypothetical protein
MPKISELFNKRVLYTLSHMEQVSTKKNILYSQPNEEDLYFDIYSPPLFQKKWNFLLLS